MEDLNLQNEIQLLKHQIELQESNYKYAPELKKDYFTLRSIRENIRQLKENLQSKIQDLNEPALSYSPDTSVQGNTAFTSNGS